MLAALQALSPVLAASATAADVAVFVVAAAMILVGALGVVASRHPVYAALSLVLTLFGVAVLFVEQGAQFLAVVQIIVYAGAIVVLFLFVIMLIGVDREENLGTEPLRAQRPLAALMGIAGLGELFALARVTKVTGQHSVLADLTSGGSNVAILGKSVFTVYLLPFELTSLLLIVAVIGAVVLARRPRRDDPVPDEQDQEPELQDSAAMPSLPGAGSDAQPDVRPDEEEVSAR
jgi:NADH-quinone oxidoreductase subunit J